MTEEITKNNHWTNPVDEWKEQARGQSPKKSDKDGFSSSVYIKKRAVPVWEELENIKEKPDTSYNSRADISEEAWEEWLSRYRWQQDVQEIKEDLGITLNPEDVQEAIREM